MFTGPIENHLIYLIVRYEVENDEPMPIGELNQNPDLLAWDSDVVMDAIIQLLAESRINAYYPRGSKGVCVDRMYLSALLIDYHEAQGMEVEL